MYEFSRPEKKLGHAIGGASLGKRKSFCCVGPRATEQSMLSCESGTHAHLSWREVNEMFEAGEIQPIEVDPEKKKTESEPDYVFRWLVPGRILQFVRHVPSRGVSAKFGVVIARALERREKWAQCWVAQVRGQVETGFL